jgi:CBS domain-containing protein
MRTAADVMTPNPRTVTPADTFQICAETMRALRIRHLVVANATGPLAGMISDADVFEHGRFEGEVWVPHGRAQDGRSIAAFVRPVDTVHRKTPLPDLLRRLVENSMDVLVVVDEVNVPLGVFTEHDALALAAAELSGEVPVSQMMARELVTAEPGMPLQDAWALLQEHGIRHLPVRDGARLLGVISARDLLMVGASVVGGGTVDQLLGDRRDLQTTTPNGSLRGAAERMRVHKIGCLPVVRGELLEGLVTATDTLKAMLRAGVA